MPPSRGIGWAVAMLVFMLLELAVFFDAGAEHWGSGIRLFFGIKGALVAVHVIGILLVLRGCAKIGGVLQMIASVPHVLELVGIVGVVGGMKAYRSPAPASS